MYTHMQSNISPCMRGSDQVHPQQFQITAFWSSTHLTTTHMGLRPQHRLLSLTIYLIYSPLYQLRFSLNKQGADGHLEAQVSINWDGENKRYWRASRHQSENMQMYACTYTYTHTPKTHTYTEGSGQHMKSVLSCVLPSPNHRKVST